ncbi:hypothetical protein AB1K70_16985 [Bremerella sp. JC770]|uniref:hypothetical protein n=1 Tax=Bremerella sp. JC770 TaxID=3232137 RepID=UPI00345781B8
MSLLLNDLSDCWVELRWSGPNHARKAVYFDLSGKPDPYWSVDGDEIAKRLTMFHANPGDREIKRELGPSDFQEIDNPDLLTKVRKEVRDAFELERSPEDATVFLIVEGVGSHGRVRVQRSCLEANGHPTPGWYVIHSTKENTSWVGHIGDAGTISEDVDRRMAIEQVSIGDTEAISLGAAEAVLTIMGKPASEWKDYAVRWVWVPNTVNKPTQ